MVKYAKSGLALLATMVVESVALDRIAGYMPYTDVTADLQKDLDQKQFETVLKAGTREAISSGLGAYYQTGYVTYPTNLHPTSVSAEYQKFKSYYGSTFDPSEWVIAALQGGETDFANGNADFSYFPNNSGSKPELVGMQECAKKGSSYIVIQIQMYQKMQEALDLVSAGCVSQAGCDSAVHAWDQAVAFHVGSREGEHGGNHPDGDYGSFPYALADKRCDDFNTCSVGGESTDKGSPAAANLKVMRYFSDGGFAVYQGDVAGATEVAEKIGEAIAVPLIQGTLRYAYRVDVQDQVFDKEKAEGATFAAGVLPKLHACSASAARTVYNNMRVGATSTNFAAVKQAFESQYQCLGVTCDEVGGMYDANFGTYLPGAGPC